MASPKGRIEADLGALRTMPVKDLRSRWRQLLKSQPPKAFGPDLLRHSIARRIQEQAYGGLSKPEQQLLDQFVKATVGKPNGKLSLSRQIRSGSELARTWKGKMHRVVVSNDGYGYLGKNYGSLSEIAQLITGTKWNGPRFFGLRQKSKNDN